MKNQKSEMKMDTRSDSHFQRLGFYMAALMFAWTLAIGISVFLNYDLHRQTFLTSVYTQAKTVHFMEMGFRNWESVMVVSMYLSMTQRLPTNI